MDLVSVDPVFNLYNLDWPIWTYPVQAPGAKFTLDGTATDSVVSPGCIISGGIIDDSVQAHGGAGVSQDFELAKSWAGIRTLRLADGTDEVHNRAIARIEFSKHAV